MKNIKLNHWYVRGNELSISLMRFYVRLHQEESDLSFKARIYDGDLNHLDLIFKTLEDSIEFIEDRISSYNSLDEINTFYQKEYIGKAKTIGEYKEG